ncbi:MAG: hypothetical protein H6707_18420 [Deltaproteobacteria bacterium]|nr:hypothetical protein [Deltaproteobacteria bacterium]
MRSKALEVNLARTRVPVVIPEEHRLLLEVTASRFGVQQATEKLLEEINHQYVGWAQTLEDLHYRALSDAALYSRHPRGGEAMTLLCGFYDKILSEGPAQQRAATLRSLVLYLTALCQHCEQGEAAIERSVSRLHQLLADDVELVMGCAAPLRRFAEALSEQAPDLPCTQAALSLLLKLNALTVEHWLAQEDPTGWLDGRAVPATLVPATHAALRQQQAQLTALETAEHLEAEQVLVLYDNARLIQCYLDAATDLEGDDLEGRLRLIDWLTRILRSPALSSIHTAAIHQINRTWTMASPDVGPQLDAFVARTFAILREVPSRHGTLDLVRTIGLDVLKKAKRPDDCRVLIEQILDLDFHRPDFAGYTDDWQVRVDPDHIKNIRTLFELIRAAPQLTEALTAALTVQLKLGGVFIADTDLFQRDVSALLAAPIEPIYLLVKRLLQLLPVYFSHIGAEGEIRDVSTEIDELRERGDPLCHFLRKQCHVESNPLLIEFTDEIIRYWGSGDPQGLRRYLPDNTYHQLKGTPECEAMQRIFRLLRRPEESVEALVALRPRDVEERVKDFADQDPIDTRRALLLYRLRELIARKYRVDHGGLLKQLRGFHRIDGQVLSRFEAALEQRDFEAAIDAALTVLERLKKIILDRRPTEAVEDIYRKRHVAVGIPSMYGRYREERFEAMGLTFRLESLVDTLFQRMIAEQNLDYICGRTLWHVLDWLKLFLRAVRVDGCRARGLAAGIEMLEQALHGHGFSVQQFINIFQQIADSLRNLIRLRYLDAYSDVLDRIVARLRQTGCIEVRPGESTRETCLRVSEGFFRDQLAQSIGLQRLDNLVGAILEGLQAQRDALDDFTMTLLMSYDVGRCFVPIGTDDKRHSGVTHLGNKGYMINRLANLGLPIPSGFVVTTELFRCQQAISAYDRCSEEFFEKLTEQVADLERRTDCRFGDPRRPLLLSVRSGSAVSMPGMLDTLLNVGMTPAIADGFANYSRSRWGAWDAYRRLCQGWGMAHGIDRDLFDELMRQSKQATSVPKKNLLPPDEMKALALRYGELVADHGLALPDDPYQQLRGGIDLVLRSWWSDRAQAYRRALQIADDWGTAVTVQHMVYGNLHGRSGTGVFLTVHPRRPSEKVELYGDYIVQGQGEDVVSGLVETFPITERQREEEGRGRRRSLQAEFPDVFARLLRFAQLLIEGEGLQHQEVEFTFENDSPDGVFVLQSRNAVLAKRSSIQTFVASEALAEARVASGVGVGGAAFVGRVARNGDEIDRLRREFGNEPILLLRPDTVPDDIDLIVASDGLLTAVGGATSHAAIAAQRLDRTCVVGCRALEIDDKAKTSSIAGRPLNVGDFLSISGIDGSVYLGRHPIARSPGEC